MAPAHRPQAGYHPGLDALRVPAILAVICLHTEPFMFSTDYRAELGWDLVYFLVHNLTLFAVPFFFCAAGYFYGVRQRRTGAPLATLGRMAARLLPAFLLWCVVYAVSCSGCLKGSGSPLANALANAWTNTGDVFRHAAADPVGFWLHGEMYHLWFLTSLVTAASLVALLVRLGLGRLVLPLGLALYLVGLCGQAYGELPWTPEVTWNTRTGPCFGTLFFGLGHAFSGGYRLTLRQGLALAALGLGLQLTETITLDLRYGAPVEHYYLGTAFMAAGVFAAGLALTDNGRGLALPALARLGSLTMGVYLAHPLVIELLRDVEWALGDLEPVNAVFPLLVYAATLPLVLVLGRTPLLRRLTI